MAVRSAEARVKRHRRVRKRVSGTTERPRLAVFRSNRHIYAQVIDDTTGRTIASASTTEAPLRDGATGTVDAAKNVGELVGDRAKSAGIERVVFDRGEFRYPRPDATLFGGARAAGLEAWRMVGQRGGGGGQRRE